MVNEPMSPHLWSMRKRAERNKPKSDAQPGALVMLACTKGFGSGVGESGGSIVMSIEEIVEPLKWGERR